MNGVVSSIVVDGDFIRVALGWLWMGIEGNTTSMKFYDDGAREEIVNSSEFRYKAFREYYLMYVQDEEVHSIIHSIRERRRRKERRGV